MTEAEKAIREAKKNERNARREARKALISKGGDGATVATLENIVETMDERHEETSESHTVLRDSLSAMKADVDGLILKMKIRKQGTATEGMDVEAFDISKVIKAFAEHRIDDSAAGAGYELEAMIMATKNTDKDGMTKKDLMSSLTGAAGGGLLPVQYRNQIFEAARSTSQLFALGVQNPNMEGFAGFQIPYEVQADGVTTVTGGKNLSPTNFQEGAVSASPTRPGFRFANFTPRQMALMLGITEAMLKQGGQFVRMFVEQVAAKDMRNQLERNALSGRGNQNSEPTGLLNRTDMVTFTPAPVLGTDSRALAFSDLKDFEFALAENDRLTDACAFYTRPAVLKGLAKQVATYGLAGADASNSKPITDLQFMSLKKLGDYVGYNLKWSTNFPKNITIGATTDAAAVMFGDWSTVWVPFWGPMEIAMSNVATVGSVSAFENALVYTRFIQMYDSNIITPDAMCVVKGFKTKGF